MDTQSARTPDLLVGEWGNDPGCKKSWGRVALGEYKVGERKAELHQDKSSFPLSPRKT